MSGQPSSPQPQLQREMFRGFWLLPELASGFAAGGFFLLTLLNLFTGFLKNGHDIEPTTPFIATGLAVLLFGLSVAADAGWQLLQADVPQD